MIRNETNGIPCFQFPNLLDCQGLWHGVFTRHGGVSLGPFKHLNVGFGLGDESDAVDSNRTAIERSIGGFPVVYVDQTHGTGILVFRKSDESGTPIASKSDATAGYLTGDAMVTDIPGTFLGVQVADCQSVLLYDPTRRVAANIHSGWRGSIQNIIGRTVDTMTTRFQCHASDILAGIGPSLGPCCSEFVNFRKEIPEPFWKYRNALDLFDFWAISRDQLVSAGVSVGHIELSHICTKCNTEQYFSYRGEGVTGRFASVIGLVP